MSVDGQGAKLEVRLGGQGEESNESGWTVWKVKGKSVDVQGGELELSLWVDIVDS